MNVIQAKMILDRVREGWDYSEVTITKALFMTGEISEQHTGAVAGGMRSAGMDNPVRETSAGAWAGRSEGVVG